MTQPPPRQFAPCPIRRGAFQLRSPHVHVHVCRELRRMAPVASVPDEKPMRPPVDPVVVAQEAVAATVGVTVASPAPPLTRSARQSRAIGADAFYGPSRNRTVRGLSLLALASVAAYWFVLSSSFGATTCR